MKKRFFLILIYLLFQLNGFGQDFQWAYITQNFTGGFEPAYGQSLVSDSQGNIYLTGQLKGTIDFDDTAGTLFLSPSTSSYSTSYIIKFDKDKNILWAKSLEGDDNFSRSIILDQNENIIVTGNIAGFQMDLDPDPTNQFIANNSPSMVGAYLIKLNPNGTFIMGKNYPGKSARHSVIDSNNNIITAFGGGANISIMKSDSNGNFIWEKFIQGNDIYPIALICDNNNDVIVRGSHDGVMTFNNISYTNPYTSLNREFICKMDSNGIPIWYQPLASCGSGISNFCDKGIVVDNQNNIYFLTSYGYDGSTYNFSGQVVQFPIVSGPDSAIIKINTNAQYQWGVPLYGDERQTFTSLAMSSNNQIFAVATVSGDTFIGNNVHFIDNAIGSNHMGILAKLDLSGNIIDLLNIPPQANSVVCDNLDNVIITGTAGLSLLQDFDPDPTGVVLLPFGDENAYVLKLGQCDTSPFTVTANQSFCSSQNPTISNLMPNSGSFKWYNSISSTSPLVSTINLVDGNIYYVSRQSGTCPESARIPVTVSINQTPALPVVSNQTFCESENATLLDLTVTGQDIKWYASLTSINNFAFSTLLQNNIDYYATQTINGCESGRNLAHVMIESVLAPTLISPQTFCIQQNATLSSISITGQNIRWYDSATNTNQLPIATALIDGTTYFATQTLNNCESLAVPVLVNIQNTLTPTGTATQTFCTTQNATVNDIVANGTDLIWYNSSGTVVPNITMLANNTTYFATQTLHNCESIGQLVVDVTLISNLNANDFSQTICDDLNDGNENIDLTGYENQLIANTTNCIFAYYASLLGASDQNSSELITNAFSYNLNSGLNNIYVRIISGNGCYQIVKLDITLANSPIITIPDIVPICERSDISIDAGSGFDSYLWSTGSTAQTITIATSGNYDITVTKNQGDAICSTTKNFEVVLSNVAMITDITIQDWTDNNNIIVINTSISSVGDYEFSIDGVNYQYSNIFTGLSNGSHTVFVRDKNGCGISKETIFIMMYEKYFTPNNDGYNDAWFILNGNQEPNMKINVFDRYGKLLKQLSNIGTWDGTFNGTPLPADDYWFVITRANGVEYKGHFALKR